MSAAVSLPEPPELPDFDDERTPPLGDDESDARPLFETRFASFTDEKYFADPCRTPSLSASIAHTIDAESPLHAWSRHPRLGARKREPTTALDNGSLSHALLLGTGKEISIISADDYKKSAARELRDLARAQGLIPVLRADYDEAKETAEKIRERFAAKGIVLDGDSEIAALWTEQTANGAKVQCRGMMDHVNLPVVYDIKSIRSAHPEQCRRNVETYGYAIQRAAYVSAIEKIRPELVGRVDFIFVFYELEAPHAVTPIRMSGAFQEMGEDAWRRAVDTWERCLRTDEWPDYTNKILHLEPSPWALKKYEEMRDANV